MHSNGAAPALVFDERFHARPKEDQIDYLKKLCASQNQALDLMQQERDKWLSEAKKLEQAVANAESAFYIQKNITQNMVTQSNADDQDTAERIHELEKKVKELGGKY